MLTTKSSRRVFQILHVWLVVAFLLLPGIAAAQFPPPMPPQKEIALYGQHVRYYEQGQGANLILLHGLGGEGSNWAANIGALSQTYHVYAPDQIGFGDSEKPFIEYKIETFVDFLAAFMQSLNIPKAILVGNSLGGWIAVDFAALHPEMVDKLVLVDAAGLSPQGGQMRLPADLNPASLAGMRKVLESIVYNKQWITDAVVRQAFERRMKRGDGYTIQRVMAGVLAGNQWVDDRLGSIRVPTLVLWGRDDELVPLSQGERFQKGLLAAKLVVLDQCGHVPQLEKPAEFNAELLKFLAQP
jgi:2-hydroxy-6-oxonona-2,4-dienedioate hydrolase